MEICLPASTRNAPWPGELAAVEPEEPRRQPAHRTARPADGQPSDHHDTAAEQDTVA